MPVLSSNNRVNTFATGARSRKEDRKPDLLCRIKYNNSLPDVPFDPKCLSYPFDQNRFITYNPTSLEKNHKWELLTENDLGVKIDLINPDAYATDLKAAALQRNRTDEKLLEDESHGIQDSKRSRQHSKFVPWMRKTEYLATEFNRFGTQTERQETKVGYNIKKAFKEEALYKDRESQMQAITKTFEEVQKPVTEHYSKPGVFALQEMYIYPDFDLWRYPFAQVIFDGDPAPAGCSVSAQVDKMSNAVIRGMMDESGEQFVAYFLPTDETLLKRKEDTENIVEYRPEESYDYKLAREYNWTVKNKASKGYEENYFFVFRDDSVMYNELETRVRLSRRRAKEGMPKFSNSRLIVKHREQNEIEVSAQKARLLHLATVQEAEEEEEADELVEEMERQIGEEPDEGEEHQDQDEENENQEQDTPAAATEEDEFIK